MERTYNNGKDLMPKDVLTFTDKQGNAHAYLGFVPFERIGDSDSAVPNTNNMKFYHFGGGGSTEKEARRDLLQFLQETLKEIESNQ